MVAAGGVWANRLGAGSIGYVSLVLTIPFILLSGYAGQIADKFSKRDVILWVKIAEVPIAIIALCGLYFANFWLSLFALLLLAVQSSFYGPAKFGIIPEVVKSQRLSHANGLINALSNVAVILGSLVAGPLTDMYYPTIQSPPAEVTAVFDEASTEPSTDTADPATTSVVLIPDPNREPNLSPDWIDDPGSKRCGIICCLANAKDESSRPRSETFRRLLWASPANIQGLQSPAVGCDVLLVRLLPGGPIGADVAGRLERTSRDQQHGDHQPDWPVGYFDRHRQLLGCLSVGQEHPAQLFPGWRGRNDDLFRDDGPRPVELHATGCAGVSGRYLCGVLYRSSPGFASVLVS